MTLLELADCCEQADGPNAGIDHAIWDLVGDNDGAPNFTASIDAAMNLVPKEFTYKNGRDMDNGDCLFTLETDDSTKYGQAKTWPLALCAASLRARATLPSPPKGVD